MRILQLWRSLPEITDMNRNIVIYGASGHGKVIADIAKLRGYENIIFYDDDKNKTVLDSYQVVHDLADYKDYDMFIAIGSNSTREMISNKYHDRLVTLIHPSAVIAKDTSIGKGVAIMAQAVVNSGTVVHDGVIINTYASIDHDNQIDEYSHISVAAHTAGTVHIGKRVFAGIGSLLTNNISVCDDVTIGAGAVVIKDIAEAGTYVGIPAWKIK